MPTREELMQLARTVHDEHVKRVKAMTRDEKFAELKAYYEIGGVFNLDIDQIKRDQIALGLSDSHLDDAILACAALVGQIFQTVPMSPDQLKAHARASDWAKHLKTQQARARGLGIEPPPFSLRRSGRSGLERAANIKK